MLTEEPRSAESAPLEQSGTSGSNGHPPLRGDIGFVGLGRMGTVMAANLAASGGQVISYVRSPDQFDKLKALDLKPTTDIAKLFECKVVISMLPDDAAAREVVFGRKDIGLVGLADGLMPGAIH